MFTHKIICADYSNGTDKQTCPSLRTPFCITFLLGNKIVTLGITNQRETTIIWDKTTGEPLYNAIGEFGEII